VKGIFVRFLSFGGAPRTTWRCRKKHSFLHFAPPSLLEVPPKPEKISTLSLTKLQFCLSAKKNIKH